MRHFLLLRSMHSLRKSRLQILKQQNMKMKYWNSVKILQCNWNVCLHSLTIVHLVTNIHSYLGVKITWKTCISTWVEMNFALCSVMVNRMIHCWTWIFISPFSTNPPRKIKYQMTYTIGKAPRRKVTRDFKFGFTVTMSALEKWMLHKRLSWPGNGIIFSMPKFLNHCFWISVSLGNLCKK